MNNSLNYNLIGKVAVVTGAGRGIGKAISIGLAKAGASVCLAARTSKEIENCTEEMKQNGLKSASKTTDVKNFDDLKALFAYANDIFGGVDMVVANAGITSDNIPVDESDPEKWREVIEVNLFGAYNTAKAAIPYLKNRGAGKIIFIGSGLGHKGFPGGSSYSCSKAGLWMLTRILAQELADYKISVNELIPGPVKTSIDANMKNKDGKTFADSEWVKKPEDVVPMLLFLATQPDTGPTAQSFSLARRDI